MEPTVADLATIYNQAVRDTWLLLHKSAVNVAYHEAMNAQWEAYNLKWRVWSAISIVLGLAISMWYVPKKETAEIRDKRLHVSNFFALIFAVGGMLAFMYPNERMQEEHRVLKDQWTVVKTELDALRATLHTLPENGQVSPDLRAQIEGIRTRTAALILSETDKVDKSALDVAREDANELLYGSGKRTDDEARAEYEKRKKAGSSFQNRAK